MATNPWKTLATRPVYDNPWISVREDQVITPSGTPGIYGVVHMKGRAAGIVPIDTDGRTVLVGQHRYTLDGYSWEIPEGGVPAGEETLVGAQRELVEETGLVAASWLELANHSLSNSVTDERCTCFLTWDLEQQVSAPDETEDLALRWLPLGEAIDMALDGRIHDVVSVVALLTAEALARRGKLPAGLIRHFHS